MLFKNLTGISSKLRMTFVIAVCCIIALVFGYFKMNAADSSPLRIGTDVMPYQTFTARQDRFIPKIIWRTSKYELHEAPQQIQDSLRRTASMNPDYTQVYLSDKGILDFVTKEFPQYLRQYNSLIPGAYRADLFRLLVLHKYGGVYNDIGHEYLCPLSEIISFGDEFVAGTEDNKQGSFQHAMHNSFLAAYPGNPLVWTMIECIMEDVATCGYNSDPLDITGPAALGHAFNVWKAMQKTDRHAAFTGYNDKIPRGSAVIHGMQIKTLSHDAQNHKLLHQGKAVISTKFPGYYKMMYNSKNERSTYDKMWRDNAVYDKKLTNCESTGSLAKREGGCC